MGALDPSAGIFLGPELPQAFTGSRGTGITFETPRNFGYVAGGDSDSPGRFRSINRTDGSTDNASLDFLRAVTGNANGDLRFTTDFRSVYASVLEDWLGADAKKILPRTFPKPGLLRV